VGPVLRRARSLRLAAALGAVLLGAAACRSVEAPEEAPPQAIAPLVTGASLAQSMGLTLVPLDAHGKVSLVAGDGHGILLFPGTTVATVHGERMTTAEPIRTRDGDALVTQADATTMRSMWAHASYSPSTWWPNPYSTTPSSGATAGRPTVPSRPSATDQPTAQEGRAWSVSVPRRAWRYIVLHHSASPTGSAAQFDAYHRKVKGWDGLGYDFVIGNGRGSPDGAVEVGYRWREQKRGAHAGDDRMNEEGIGICLVGDFTKTRPTPAQMASLNRLCNFLSAYCDIPRENYRLHGDVRNGGTVCPGPLFPRDFLSIPRATSVGAR
jgi:hypothetical protein